MSLYTKLKSTIFIWKESRIDKKPFNKKMKGWLTWHKPYEPNTYAYCPNCAKLLRNNGQGFFRCTDKCKKSFIILESTDR